MIQSYDRQQQDPELLGILPIFAAAAKLGGKAIKGISKAVKKKQARTKAEGAAKAEQAAAKVATEKEAANKKKLIMIGGGAAAAILVLMIAMKPKQQQQQQYRPTMSGSKKKILVDGIEKSYDLSKYPKRYRIQEVFLDIAEKNPGKDVQLIENGKIIGWRND